MPRCLRLRHLLTVTSSTALLACTAAAWAGPSDPWLDAVKVFAPGSYAGFGADRLPVIVLGPPQGGGLIQQSVDVVSLGNGGSITVVFRDNVVVDGPGDDLVIYENAFHAGSETGPIFAEYGIVELSPDGKTWTQVPYDAESGTGLAGAQPVLSTSENGIDALAPEGGGDRFDIGEVGLSLVRFVRITDGGDAIPDPGNVVPPANKGGFDLDAMGAIHSSPPGVVHGTVTSGGVPIADARVTLIPSDGTRRLHRRTRADGTFRFRPVLPSGSVTIRARRVDIGQGETSTSVSLEALDAEADLAIQ
jgi:hypothetical protein